MKNFSTLLVLTTFPASVFAGSYCQDLANLVKFEAVILSSPLETYKVTGKGHLHFLSAPSSKCKTDNNLFITPDDTVIVYMEYKNFYYAMHIGESNTTEGWIHAERLKPTGKNIGPNHE